MSFKFDLKKIFAQGAALLLIFQFLIPYPVVAQETVIESTEIDPSLYDEDGFLLNQPFRNSNGTAESGDETTVGVERTPLEPDAIRQGEAASCSDYYKFGSVDMNLVTDHESYVAGDVVMVIGAVRNNNSYPLVGVDIKARLVKDIPQPDAIRSEILVVDEFDVAQNVTIDANSDHEISYGHLLPFNAPTGEYEIFLYAVEQDRFNMSGLSFTNDIIAGNLQFHVEGKTQDHVYLDQTRITVGGLPHNVMAFMTKHLPGQPVVVNIPLYNPEESDKQMSITYKLYSWDSANPNNLISTKTEEYLVPAQSEVMLEYSMDSTDLPVYYLSITAEPAVADSDPSVFREKTMSNIRFTVEGNSMARINYAGVDQYPLKRNVEATLATCFHNTNSNIDLNNSRIETVLYDQNGRELARTEFEGKTTPNIDAVIQKFKPTRDVTEFSVVSTIFDWEGKVVDKVEKKYACQDINADLCPQQAPIVPMILGGTLIALGLGLLIYKRKTFNSLRV